MTTFRALRALYWLHDHRHHPMALPAEVVPPEDARTVYDELRTDGAIANTLTMSGHPDGAFDFLLTTEGCVQARNACDSYRHELALRRVLECLRADFDQTRLHLSEAADDFSGRLSASEIREATHYLVALGLAKGSKRADGEFFHVEITPQGRAAARRPGLIDSGAAPNVPVTNVSADNYGTLTVGNQVIGGQGHTVTANVTQQGASLDEVLEAISKLRSDVDAAPGIDEDDRSELLEEIDTMTGRAPRRGLGWLKAALVAFATQLATTAGQEFANQALEIGSQII